MTAPVRPDVDLMKRVNRQFVTGVTVVTALDGDKPRGLAVNAFASISLDPPTVMVAVQHTSSSLVLSARQPRLIRKPLRR